MFLPAKLLSILGRSRPRHGESAQKRKHARIRWAAVVLYSVLSIGLPIPAGGFSVTGEAFPCMHHRCGCHSAEQCWRDCCCMSLEQKLAWAKQNDVTPPKYVLAEARSRGLLDSRSKSKCCCNASRIVARCEPSDESDCGGEKTPTENRSTATQTSADGSIVLIEALKCRGFAESWLGAGVSLPPPTIDCEISMPLVSRVEETPVQLNSWAASPPTPPPRCPPRGISE